MLILDDLNKLPNVSNYATRGIIDLSIARTAAPLGLITPSRGKINGLILITKGTGIYTIGFKFYLDSGMVGLPEAYFLSSELENNTVIPYIFKDLVITNVAQPGIVNPVYQIGYNIEG